MKGNKAYKKHKQTKGNKYSLKKDKCQVKALVNTLGMAKVRSNLHPGQYTGSVSCDHGQRQALMEPL